MGDQWGQELGGSGLPFPVRPSVEESKPLPCTFSTDVLLLEGVTLTQDARQLNGSERVVLDGLLTPGECGELLQLAEVRKPRMMAFVPGIGTIP